jgi:hypothetical protein
MKYPGFRYPGYRLSRNNYYIECPNPECELTKNNVKIEAYIVDEYIYENPPTFLIATVDKIAQLPCKDESCIGSIHGEHLPVKILTLSISQISRSS